MKSEFVTAHENEFGIARMCRVLGIGRSGYYAWRARSVSQRAQANEILVAQIKEEHRRSRETYGSPRSHAALRRKGICCGRKRIARLMRLQGMAARRRQKHPPLTTQRARKAIPAPDLLKQDFSSSAPNQKWVSDITYIDTAEGWLYLASVLDLFSRRVVGWAMSDRVDTALVAEAFEMAVCSCHPEAGWLHHSDQGCQYTSATYQDRLAQIPCRVSMSRVGNCYDNAVMESFFGTLKAECATQPFASRAQARTTIFEYIEAWYNRQRLHSSLGYLSPVEFEQKSRH